MTNSENGVRIPFIVRAPWAQQSAGMRLPQLAEAVDLYKTIADLTGVGAAAVESGVDGISLAHFLAGGADMPSSREFARSQFPRCFTALDTTVNTSHFPFARADRTDCQDVPRHLFDLMGYSIRTEKWRYTEVSCLLSFFDIAQIGFSADRVMTRPPYLLPFPTPTPRHRTRQPTLIALAIAHAIPYTCADCVGSGGNGMAQHFTQIGETRRTRQSSMPTFKNIR